MNFAYGVIVAVGVLAAISIGLIASSPDDIPEPRVVSVEDRPVACTMQWDPMCGIDGETYGNSCMLDASNVKLDYAGECVVAEPEAQPTPELKPCTREYVPVCGVDGETYGNMCTLEAADIELDYEGECVVVEPTPEPTPEPATESLPMVVTVSVPEGSGVPGCDETNECYIPYEIDVAVGGTVTWSNDDTAAHTVTSGNISDGHDGVFDSSLFMSGVTFEVIFTDAGTYDYFCMVHPWMTGIVNVN